MTQITPKTIAERHSKFPEGTEQMIEYYANMQVRKHIERLLKYSSITSVPTSNVIVIVSEYDVWKTFKDFDLFVGLDVEVLKKSDQIAG